METGSADGAGSEVAASAGLADGAGSEVGAAAGLADGAGSEVGAAAGLADGAGSEVGASAADAGPSAGASCPHTWAAGTTSVAARMLMDSERVITSVVGSGRADREPARKTTPAALSS